MPPREINSDVEEVVESIRRIEWDGVLVIMAKDGTNMFDMVSNQGDAGGVLLFLERFKRHLLNEADKINIIMNQSKPETPA